MPSPLVECVPNFSEGRNAATIDALRRALSSVPGVRLLDVQADAAHNRSVFTFVAPPDASVEAVLAAMRVATERIDVSRHSGEHPRMGATDVVPFVPVRDATMDDCVALARRLAERAGAELRIPIYLYAKAATRPERERLPDIRKGEFEGLRERLGGDPAPDPDFGPKRIPPTAGATAIGARPFLAAFNIYLDTRDIAIAKEIAKQIRTSSGGLPAVQASGFEVGGKAQVSMNLLDIDVTSPAAVFMAVESAARQRGVGILTSEVVGLIPERAVLGAGAASLKLPDVEAHLLEPKIRAAEGPTPDASRGRGARRRGADAARDGPWCRAVARAGAGNRDDRQPERTLRCEGRRGPGPRRAVGRRGERQGERGVAVGAGPREVAAGRGGPIGEGGQSAVVSTRGGPPLSRMATVCSKWADRDPSSVTTVHLSSSVRMAAPPAFTMGSMASVMPGTSRGPRFGFP